MDKIKTPNNTLRTLNMHGTFYGSIERHLIPVNLPNLTSLSFSRGGGAYFHPDDRSASGLTNNSGGESFCPDVPEGVTSYSITSNDFRSVDLNSISSGSVTVAITSSDGSVSTGTTTLPNGSYSFKKAPNLTNLNVSGNYYLNDDNSSGFYQPTSFDKLTNVNYSAGGLAIANMQNSPSLKTYYQTYNYSGTVNPLVSGSNAASATYQFSNCSSLEYLTFYATNLGAINFPPAFSNVNLQTLDLRYTNVKGGTPGDESEVISSNTFFQCVNIRNIYIHSSNLLSKPINVDAFKQNPKLYYFWISSGGNVSGNLPDFSTNSELQYLYLERNNFSGSLPNFGSNGNIYYVNVRHNNFSNKIPEFSNLSNLRYLYLNNNNFTSIGEPDNLPNLQYYYAHNNQLAGEIPDFSTCANLRYLTLYNNQLSAYKLGSFKTLYKIKYFDLSNNKLNQTAQDNILLDLFDNWNAIKRGGVTVNLRGNTNNINVNETPSDEVKEKALILVQNGWNISVNGGLT